LGGAKRSANRLVDGAGAGAGTALAATALAPPATLEGALAGLGPAAGAAAVLLVSAVADDAGTLAVVLLTSGLLAVALYLLSATAGESAASLEARGL